MTHDDIHPRDRTALGVCDSDRHCVTPGQRRKVNVYHHMGVPVLHVCKGCDRRAAKKARATP